MVSFFASTPPLPLSVSPLFTSYLCRLAHGLGPTFFFCSLRHPCLYSTVSINFAPLIRKIMLLGIAPSQPFHFQPLFTQILFTGKSRTKKIAKNKSRVKHAYCPFFHLLGLPSRFFHEHLPRVGLHVIIRKGCFVGISKKPMDPRLISRHFSILRTFKQKWHTWSDRI